MNPAHIPQALHALLGEREIIADPAPLLADRRGRYIGRAAAAVMPDRVENVQKLVRWCAEHRVPITPQGGNTGLCGAAVPNGGILLNLSRLNRIRSLSLADNAITVEAGAILQNVQEAAAQAGRLFPLSLASEGSCQIGGNIACNAGGLNVVRYGTTRDLVLGLEVVLPDGSLLSHLAPLHENTTGYDIRHLFIGSEGTLGIITGATLKLFAPSQTTETAWVGLDNVQAAISLLSNIKNHFAERLCSFELVSRFALQLSAAHSRLAEPLNAEWHILLELTDSLPRHDLQDELAEFLCQNGGEHSIIAQSDQQRRDLWALRENISAAQRTLGTSIKHDIAVPIARTAEFIEQCGRDLTEQHPDIQLVVFGHLGDGSLHYNTFFPNELGDSVYRREEAVNATVYRHVLHNHGTIAAEHGIGTLKKSWLPQVRTADEIALMRAIKSQLDPNHLFNPNKLLPD